MITMITVVMITGAEGQLHQSCCRREHQVHPMVFIAVQLLIMIILKLMVKVAV